MKALAIWVTLLCTCLAWVIKGGSPEIDPKAELDPKTGPVYETSSPSSVFETPSSPARLPFIWENSAIREDRHYNNGLDLSFTTRMLDAQSIWAFPIRTLSPFLFQRSGPDTDDRLNWTIFGQSIFTSSDHSASNPDPKDRPYAGWLYTGLDFIQNHNDRELTSLEFLAGVIGPWAGGKQVQNWAHELLGQ
ncbi:MAG: DUF2219 family protein, partial [Verrucomicrobia bacterium]|nr:DUF2219 family protein [Verrucomicrobiota bacterium]